MTRKEAIRRIKAWNLDSDDMEVLEVVIPELTESEDEKFRKYILRACKECVEANDSGLELSMDTTKKLLSWLEKQKEQKPNWKPSKEQMADLCRAEGRLRIEGESVLANKLAELWEQLRKLRYGTEKV